MKLPVTQALYAYWLTQRGERRLPDRHDLDPADMRGVLPHTFMIDVDASGYPVRLSGTRLDALFGRDLKDQSFLDLWSEQDRSNVVALIAGVLDGACPAVAGLNGAPTDYPQEQLELLLLPLRHNGRTHTRLLCSMALRASPSWLGLRSIDALALTTWRFVDPAFERSAERIAAGGSRRHHLVVFEGGRATQPILNSQRQVGVKVGVSRSSRMFLSTRHQ